MSEGPGRRDLLIRGLLLLVLATVGWSPVGHLGRWPGLQDLLLPGLVVLLVGGLLAELGRWRAGKRGASLALWGPLLGAVGLLAFAAGSAAWIPQVWWMHPVRAEHLDDWLVRSWQPTAVLVPLGLAGIGHLLAALVNRARVTGVLRALTVLGGAAWAGAVSARSALLRPWWVPDGARDFLQNGAHDAIPPSHYAAALGALLGAAIVSVVWAVRPVDGRIRSGVVHNARDEVVLRLSPLGPKTSLLVRRIAWTAVLLALACVGTDFIAVGRWSLLPGLLAVYFMVEALARVALGAAHGTTLRLTPTGARLERRTPLGRRRVDLPAHELELAVSRDWWGSFLQVAPGQIVGVDLPVEALQRTIDGLRQQLQIDAPDDVARTHAALGRSPTKRSRWPAEPWRLTSLLVSLVVPAVVTSIYLPAALDGRSEATPALAAAVLYAIVLLSPFLLRRGATEPSPTAEVAEPEVELSDNEPSRVRPAQSST